MFFQDLKLSWNGQGPPPHPDIIALGPTFKTGGILVSFPDLLRGSGHETSGINEQGRPPHPDIIALGPTTCTFKTGGVHNVNGQGPPLHPDIIALGPMSKTGRFIMLMIRVHSREEMYQVLCILS